MTVIQPALEGMPTPEPSEDFETWAEQVRPAFVRAAATGREFASWHIKVAEQLPEPPNPKAMWGQLLHRLHDEGLLQPTSWTTTRDGSGVRTWRGTRAARAGRVA
jgi:hypothetical protein